jgi:DNA-binding SARP family transcriptional activator/TolB-like protein
MVRVNSRSQRGELSMKSGRTFEVRLLGSPSIAAENGAVLTGRAAQRHRLALLALLVLAPGRTSGREKLMALLWPERGTVQARRLLNQAVYSLRKTIGEQSLLSEGDGLRLNCELIRADVMAFESALAREDFENAAAHYGGPFLDGFFLDDAPEFERWADRERDRLADAHARALEALAADAEVSGDFATAVEWWKARAARDPYDSRVAVRLMQGLERSGNRAGALQHAVTHQRLLREEFGAEPDPSVLALAELLRADPTVRVERAPDWLPAPRTIADFPAAVTDLSLPDSPGQPPLATPSKSPRRRHPVVRHGLGALVLSAVLLIASQSRPGPPTPPPTLSDEPSIAVLPLAGLGTEPDDASMADGMTEQLIGMLATTRGMRVIASTSVSGFRDRQLDVRGIADSLGVANILEGSLQKIGSRIRVHVRLVDGRDGSTRWSETYDRELQDVFAVQDEIARAVTDELGVRVVARSGAALRRYPTQNIAAYELYLRGSDPILLRSDSAAREGLEYFRQAIALDPTYAAAHAGIARMYIRVGAGVTPNQSDWLAQAEEAALRALALDESLAEAHATLGVVRQAARDLSGAEAHYERAIALDPTSATFREWLGMLYIWTGRPEEALAEAERAVEVDPLSPSANAELARALLANGRCDDALERLDRMAELEPPLLRTAAIRAQCHIQDQRWSEAISVLRPQAERGERNALALLGLALARTGQSDEAVRIGADLQDQWRRGNGGAVEIAWVFAGLDDLDQAFAWLDVARQEGSLIPFSRHIPIMLPGFEGLRRDPRFDRVREDLGPRNRESATSRS